MLPGWWSTETLRTPSWSWPWCPACPPRSSTPWSSSGCCRQFQHAVNTAKSFSSCSKSASFNLETSQLSYIHWFTSTVFPGWIINTIKLALVPMRNPQILFSLTQSELKSWLTHWQKPVVCFGQKLFPVFTLSSTIWSNGTQLQINHIKNVCFFFLQTLTFILIACITLSSGFIMSYISLNF